MIFRRVLLAFIAASAFSAAAAVAVFALAFCLYAFVEPWLGRAGAAATVAGVTALGMAFFGLLMALANRKPPPKPPTLAGGLVERVVAFIRQRPVTSLSAAIGAGVMAVRNPKYLGELLRAFFDDASKKR